MAIDYISTAPWNNPFNPYPKYNSVSLSATYIHGPLPLCICTLSNITSTEYGLSFFYTTPDYNAETGEGYAFFIEPAAPSIQLIISNGNADSIFFCELDEDRSLPFHNPGEGKVRGWDEDDIGSGFINTLLFSPNTNDLTS